MCRWMAWLGQPVLVEELLFNTQHGIVDQSLHSRMGAETTNGDGFGLGLVRRGRRPRALPQRRAGLVGREPARARRPRRVAAVPRPRPRRDRLARAADELPPVPPPQLAVRPQRLRRRPARAPARPHARDRPGALRRRPGLDRHRGRLPPRAHPRARGGPDRRDGADRRLHRGDAAAHGVPGAVQGTFGISDGETLWAVRYATEGTARTLFASADVDAIHRLHPDNARLSRLGPDDRLIVSEPFADLPGVWQEIAQSSAVTVRYGGDLEHQAFQPRQTTVPTASGPPPAATPGD